MYEFLLTEVYSEGNILLNMSQKNWIKCFSILKLSIYYILNKKSIDLGIPKAFENTLTLKNTLRFVGFFLRQNIVL